MRDLQKNEAGAGASPGMVLGHLPPAHGQASYFLSIGKDRLEVDSVLCRSCCLFVCLR